MCNNQDNQGKDWICKKVGHDWEEVERKERKYNGEHIGGGFYQ